MYNFEKLTASFSWLTDYHNLLIYTTACAVPVAKEDTEAISGSWTTGQDRARDPDRQQIKKKDSEDGR